MMRKLIVLAMVLALTGGCSVKEDRTGCPCRLVLDFSNIDTVKIKSLNLLAVLDGEVILSDRIDAASFDREYVRDVPGGSLRVNVWGGGDDRIEQEQGVVIPYGCECPPIYMHSSVIDTRRESCREVVDLCKNHCRLTVLMEGMDSVPYSMTFRGNVDGYGLDGLPSAGDFSCVAYPGDSGDSQALLPRQTDSSLLLEVDDGTSVPKTFALGEHIASSGYDWTARDLEDVTIILDYYVTSIKIIIQEWDREYVYNVTL